MRHARHEKPDGTWHQFTTDAGTVWAHVVVHDEQTASVSFIEQDAALDSIGLDDSEARELPSVRRARNRFGTGVMLQIARKLREEHSDVRVVLTDNRTKSSAMSGRIHARRVR